MEKRGSFFKRELVDGIAPCGLVTVKSSMLLFSMLRSTACHFLPTEVLKLASFCRHQRRAPNFDRRYLSGTSFVVFSGFLWSVQAASRSDHAGETFLLVLSSITTLSLLRVKVCRFILLRSAFDSRQNANAWAIVSEFTELTETVRYRFQRLSPAGNILLTAFMVILMAIVVSLDSKFLKFQGFDCQAPCRANLAWIKLRFLQIKPASSKDSIWNSWSLNFVGSERSDSFFPCVTLDAFSFSLPHIPRDW